MIKTNHIIPLLLNNRIPTTNCFFFLPKTIHIRYKAEHKRPPLEHTSPIRNTSEKFSSALNNRTLRDITHLLDPYKRNSSDSLITTLTHILHI